MAQTWAEGEAEGEKTIKSRGALGLVAPIPRCCRKSTALGALSSLANRLSTTGPSKKNSNLQNTLQNNSPHCLKSRLRVGWKISFYF